MASFRPALYYTMVAAILLPACSRGPAKQPNGADASPAAPIFNDTARFLAGIAGRAQSPFKPLEANAAWKTYSSEVARTWAEAEKDQFAAVDAFQRRELAGLHTGSSFVLYPFSGPDVLYATRFFPNRRTYVLAGLEPVGTLKPPEAYSEKKLERELNGWKQALASIFSRSFFVTSEMDSEFHGRVANGLLPMILLLLVRSGYTIDDVRYGHLDDNGVFVADPAEPVKHKGVELKFRARQEPSSRVLFYFSTNLGSEFETNPSFARFLKSQGTPDTLVKSASFLLHWKMCSGFRNYVLESSNLILEDDTGVPYHYFDAANWKVRLYGEYSRPDRPFRREYQHDLAEAFQDSSKVRELGFSLGYGYGRRPSSLILAERVKKTNRGS